MNLEFSNNLPAYAFGGLLVILWIVSIVMANREKIGDVAICLSASYAALFAIAGLVAHFIFNWQPGDGVMAILFFLVTTSLAVLFAVQVEEKDEFAPMFGGVAMLLYLFAIGFAVRFFAPGIVV